MSLRTTSGVIAVEEWQRCHRHAGADIVAQQHAGQRWPMAPFWCLITAIFVRGNLSALNGAGIRSTPWLSARQYRDIFPCFSRPMGSAQRTANGNTFICESAFGRLFEVTPQGETVWEYIIPYFNTYRNTSARGIIPGLQNSAFRAHRYAADALPWLK